MKHMTWKKKHFWGNIWREKSNKFWGNKWGEKGKKEVTSWESIFCRSFSFTFNQMFSSIRWWCFPSTKANIWENKNLFGSWYVGLSDVLITRRPGYYLTPLSVFFTQICSRLNNQSKKCFFVQLWQCCFHTNNIVKKWLLLVLLLSSKSARRD